MSKLKDGGGEESLRAAERRALQASGFSEVEIGLLVAGRERFRSGLISDETQQSKRMWFVRWLYEHCVVNDGYCGEVRRAEDPVEFNLEVT